ncbi:MAG: PAS domain S-box protein [Cytophagales bacterium]
MNFRISLRYKILFGLIFILIPVFLFALYNYSAIENYKALLLENESAVNDLLISKLDKLNLIVILFTLFIFLSSLVLLVYTSNSLLKNILYTSKVIESLSKGENPIIENKSIVSDEITDMLDNVQSMVKNLNETALFAVKIGHGQLDAQYTPMGENDSMGQALLNMRNNLLTASIKDEERNKIIVCNAEISNILRSHTQIDVMGDELLKYICSKIGAIQGAFYTFDNDQAIPTINLENYYAYNKKKFIKKQFKIGEGLVGQAAYEKDIIFRTEIPRDYVSVTSGLIGENRPTCILIVPLLTNENLYGLLEFASFKVFNNLEIEMVKQLSEIIAQTIFNLQVNERTAKHLEESQMMGKELQEQSLALQKNAEDMQLAQEELTRTNHQLNQKIEEVNRSQKKIQALLENSSEIIMVVDSQSDFLYVSPSINSILGYTIEEINTKKSILELLNADDTKHFNNAIKEILEFPENSLNIEFRIKDKSGNYIYTESSIKNMIHESAIGGLVLNIRDISARKQAEKEARMRSQMQSLSENSPDLITRLNKEGKVYYINPAIEKLTLQKPEEFLQKNVIDTPLDDKVKTSWLDLVNKVLTEKDKVQVEMNFPSDSNGSLIMNVNAIPEYGESENIESILLVSNDITDRKKAEIEIKNKNTKITESINYARRIQVAILPDLERIRQLFPEFFMFYKPRDVVSGDFPWFVESGDDIYIAAVDCTGHGVPGAMLSLIGYFLLNDIVKSQRITEPGIILDMLDSGVTETLKQNVEGNEMKDGMDICLCRINKKEGIFQYAGAHRPLYLLRNNEIIEFKGDKFAIGGGIYKNQTNFTNHNIEILPNDSFFFCSDGFPDQFGGPDNKKIGPSRIKQLIIDNSNEKQFNSVENNFVEFFNNWMGVHKQMDDVLMIGLKIN